MVDKRKAKINVYKSYVIASTTFEWKLWAKIVQHVLYWTNVSSVKSEEVNSLEFWAGSADLVT